MVNFSKKKTAGFTITELMIALGILAVLAVLIITTLRFQLAKARDSKRKSDLLRIQKVFEDYLNDQDCYPSASEITVDVPLEQVICRKPFSPYDPQLPCDPANSYYHNYFYSTDSSSVCKKWYKIYATLENTKDDIIEKMGCSGGCGPGGRYNYFVSSPNVALAQKKDDEYWPDGTNPPAQQNTPTPLQGQPSGSIATPTQVQGASPTPTNIPMIPTATPTSLSACAKVGGVPGTCFGICFPSICRTCCPDPGGIQYRCQVISGDFCCVPDLTCQQ